jgi:lipopolysaccharide transport system ATP-binding protein
MRKSCRPFVVIRDLRDTLVSLYFSWKISHFFHLPWQHRCRQILNSANKEQGLLYFIGQGEISRFDGDVAPLFLKTQYELANRLDDMALTIWMSEMLDYIVNIQTSWLSSGALFIKYEDLIADEFAIFEQIIDYCQISVDRERLHEIIRYNTFETVTGRQRGQEDVTAHQRKGIVGDWRNHFSDRVKEAFKERLGEVLIKTKYECDLNW